MHIYFGLGFGLLTSSFVFYPELSLEKAALPLPGDSSFSFFSLLIYQEAHPSKVQVGRMGLVSVLGSEWGPCSPRRECKLLPRGPASHLITPWATAHKVIATWVGDFSLLVPFFLSLFPFPPKLSSLIMFSYFIQNIYIYVFVAFAYDIMFHKQDVSSVLLLS